MLTDVDVSGAIRKVSCPNCERARFTMHQVCMPGDPDCSFVGECDVCGAVFQIPATEEHPERIVHDLRVRLKHFVCDACGGNQAKLEFWSLNADGRYAYEFTCGKCSVKFEETW